MKQADKAYKQMKVSNKNLRFIISSLESELKNALKLSNSSTTPEDFNRGFNCGVDYALRSLQELNKWEKEQWSNQ